MGCGFGVPLKDPVALLAQLVEASDSKSVECRFESCGGYCCAGERRGVVVNVYEAIGIAAVAGGGATIFVVHEDRSELGRMREVLAAVALEYSDFPTVRRDDRLEVGVGVVVFVSPDALREILPVDAEVVVFGGARVPGHVREENFVVDY